MFDRVATTLVHGANNNCVTVEMVILIHHGDWKRAVQNQLQTSEMVTITGRRERDPRAHSLHFDYSTTQLNEAATNAPLSLLAENFSLS